MKAITQSYKYLSLCQFVCGRQWALLPTPSQQKSKTDPEECCTQLFDKKEKREREKERKREERRGEEGRGEKRNRGKKKKKGKIYLPNKNER